MKAPYMRGRFEYQVVAGAGVYGMPCKTIAAAKALLHKIKPKWNKYNPPFEIERVKLLTNGARRYYRWRAGDWDSTSERRCSATAADLAHWESP